MFLVRNTETLKPSLPLTTYATGVLTSDNTELTDGDTVTIGSIVYRFKDTPALAYDVKRNGTTADTTLANLVKAINATGTPGTEYFAGTLIHPQVSAGAVTAHATTLTSKLGGVADNLIATTETSSHLSFAHATLWGGDGGDLTLATLNNGQTVYSAAIDVSAYSEILAFLNVLSHAGTTPTLDVSFDFSPDGVTWMATGDALTQVTTTDSLTFKRLTSIFGKYVRAKLIVAGTNPQYKITLSLIGKS